MSASLGKTLAIILLVIIVIAAVAGLRYLVFPWGITGGVFHGFHNLRLNGTGFWAWPFIGLAGLFGLAVLFLWIAVVVWVYRDAEKRGLNGAVWALVVFFAHVIGLVIYVLIRSEHPVAAPASGAPAPACPRCGKSIGHEHAFCPHCGERLRPVCPKCAAEVQPDWKACPKCGEKI